jgi:hypothetical protein
MLIVYSVNGITDMVLIIISQVLRYGEVQTPHKGVTSTMGVTWGVISLSDKKSNGSASDPRASVVPADFIHSRLIPKMSPRP